MQALAYKNDWGSVVGIMMARRNADTPLIQQMVAIRDAYNCDVVIPLADTAGEPSLPPAQPHIVADTIDNTAMRAAGQRPTIYCPALDPTNDASVKRAGIRRKALYARWHDSALWDVLLYRSFRHLVGYGTNAIVVVPDMVKGKASVEIRDPLTAYPDSRVGEETRRPINVGFVYGRSADWIRRNYPQAIPKLNLPGTGRYQSDLWDLVEWIDEEAIVVGILGPRYPTFSNPSIEQRLSLSMELSRIPNRAGTCPVAIPRRVTLDRVAGQVASILDQEALLQRLTALDIVAAEKAIFADMVAIGKDGRPPQLISGRWKDGRTGEINLMTDGAVQVLQTAPGPLTHPVLDRIERNAAMAAGKSPFMGGETTGSLRTGRAIDSLGGYSVDPRIEEAQKIMARGLMQVNESIIAVEKGYWPSKKYTCFSGWPGDMSHVIYTPSKDFESDENVVTYPMPGTDVQGATVALAQLTGAGLMSRETARRKHPLIDDAEHEEHSIIAERLEDAVLQGFLTQASQGTLPLPDASRIKQLVDKGTDIVEAILQAHNEAQARQATEAPAAQPGQAMAPEQAPGLAAPGQGIEAPPAGQAVTDVNTPPDIGQLHTLLRNLRSR